MAKLMQYCKGIRACHASWQEFCETNPDDYTCREWWRQVAADDDACREWWRRVTLVACVFLWARLARLKKSIDADMEALLQARREARLEADHADNDAASDATVETLAYSGDGNDDAWSACGTEAGQEE